MVYGRLRKGYNEPRDEERLSPIEKECLAKTMEKNQQALALNIRMIPCLRYFGEITPMHALSETSFSKGRF
jgi:hypothetical protein